MQITNKQYSKLEKSVERMLKPYFCACMVKGVIILKWFSNREDACLYHAAMHLSDATKLALSPKLSNRRQGQDLIQKAWGLHPVTHLEG